MLLYLVQHGNNVPDAVDPEKPLSEEGRGDVEKIGKTIEQLSISVQEIRHSSKKRAIETAKILSQYIDAKNGLREDPTLSPNGSITNLVDEVQVINNDLMIVGHLPYLSKLAGTLLAGSEDKEVVRFQRGGVLCLERETTNNLWHICWMIVPALVK